MNVAYEFLLMVYCTRQGGTGYLFYVNCLTETERLFIIMGFNQWLVLLDIGLIVEVRIWAGLAKMADISFSFINCRLHCPNQKMQYQRITRPKTVQVSFLLAWKPPCWGLPLAPVDWIYTLFSKVHLIQMVPLQSHSSRTLTCIAVKDQETVNNTEGDTDLL